MQSLKTTSYPFHWRTNKDIKLTYTYHIFHFFFGVLFVKEVATQNKPERAGTTWSKPKQSKTSQNNLKQPRNFPNNNSEQVERPPPLPFSEEDLSTWVANRLNMEIDCDSVFDKSDLLVQRKFGI